MTIDASNRNCTTADQAKIATYPDGGTCFVTFQWDDGGELMLPYGSTQEAITAVRAMGYGQ